MKNTLKIERLRQYAEYLRKQEFVSADYFNPLPQLVYIDRDDNPVAVNPILFLAVFEMPHIFPESWAYSSQFEPILKNGQSSNTFDAMSEWFGLSELQAEHLLFQGMQLPHLFGGRMLTETSSKYDLVFNIEELIKQPVEPCAGNEFIICLN